MTIDDDSSIYVGGLPYESTEDNLRQVLDRPLRFQSLLSRYELIINDCGAGEDAMGLLRTNPRSAMCAFDETDGGTIDGHTVRVNEVRTRGGRSNFVHESFQRNSERDIDGNRGRSREKDHDHYRDRYRENHREKSRERDEERERGYENVHDRDRD